MLDAVFAQVRRGRRAPVVLPQRTSVEQVSGWVGDLLAERSQASSLQIANAILTAYGQMDAAQKDELLFHMASNYAADPSAIRAALAAYDAAPDAQALNRIGKMAEAPRQEILRRLNQVPAGTAALVAMRADLLRRLPVTPALQTLDDDFVHLLRSWFNRGFLVMRRIDWSSPADLLERIIRYEAVHSIGEWGELRDRLLPPDRRCYGFFHPAMGDEPLIFVEVALTDAVPDSIQAVLASGRTASDPSHARVATFYSISNCQPGLANISFGQFLIKQVVDDLIGEFPALDTFVTLSPIPGLTRWLEAAAVAGDASAVEALADRHVDHDRADDNRAMQARLALAARYFLQERDQRGRPIDPVARFHLGNGARMERLCWMGDTSARGLRQSGGMMVNYLYDLASLRENQDAFARHGTVAASAAVRVLLATAPPSRANQPVG